MGEHVSKHQIDKEFNLNQHLKEVFNSSVYNKDWKKLYWYFWSMVTTLESTKCVRCGKVVQIISMNTCLSHSAKINYPTIHQNDKIFESRVGIYACCGQKETRFNVNVNNVQNGCSKTDHFFDRDFLTEKEQRVFDVFQEKREDLILLDVEVEKTDRMSLLEVDNHEFLQELANGRNSKVYSSDTETATTESNGPSGLIISVKVNKKKPPKRHAKNLKSIKNEHQWTVTRSLRWNQDSIRNADVKRFEELIKQQRDNTVYEPAAAAGVYQQLENELLKTAVVKPNSKR